VKVFFRACAAFQIWWIVFTATIGTNKIIGEQHECKSPFLRSRIPERGEGFSCNLGHAWEYFMKLCQTSRWPLGLKISYVIGVAIIFAGACYFVMGLFLVSLVQHVSGGGEGYGFTKDMTPVDIDLSWSTPEFWAEHNPGRPYPAPVKVRIPKAYMVYAGNWHGGLQSSIDITFDPVSLMPIATSAEKPSLDAGVDVVVQQGAGYIYAKYVVELQKYPTTESGKSRSRLSEQ
jgi:hypothetical protein